MTQPILDDHKNIEVISSEIMICSCGGLAVVAAVFLKIWYFLFNFQPSVYCVTSATISSMELIMLIDHVTKFY